MNVRTYADIVGSTHFAPQVSSLTFLSHFNFQLYSALNKIVPKCSQVNYITDLCFQSFVFRIENETSNATKITC